MSIKAGENRAAPVGRKRIRYVGNQEALSASDMNGGSYEFLQGKVVEVPAELADGRADRAGLLAREDFEEVS